MRAAVLQLNAQGMSSTKLYNYIRIAQKQGVKLLLLGEYILNPFFKELEHMSFSMIKEQADHQIKILKELSGTYNITIVAPIITIKKKDIYKSVIKFSPSSTSYYNQQLLINYPHWNEEKFFSNTNTVQIQSPLVFKLDGFKFALINGFEIHFDEIFAQLVNKNIDCILLPSVSTFESFQRWKNLILSRAFTHNCYILRANRIGEYQNSDGMWKFYGDSLLASPNGELIEHLRNKEELMIVDMSHTEVVQARKTWGFKESINKKLN